MRRSTIGVVLLRQTPRADRNLDILDHTGSHTVDRIDYTDHGDHVGHIDPMQ